jgi:hypothetical protein
MMRQGLFSIGTAFWAATGFILVFSCKTAVSVEPADPPDFKEVYDLVSAHAAGLTKAQIDRAAVQGLVSALAPKVTLVGEDKTKASTDGPALSRTNLYDGDIAYMRVRQVGAGLQETFQKSYAAFVAEHKVKGLVLDLRYTDGTDYAAAAGVADLFVSKERPLINWGSGNAKSKEKEDAITLPVAVLVNHQTSGAAEALAALLRETGNALVLGSLTAGQALVSEEFPLKNGQRLRIATAPVQIGENTPLTPEGVKPDISVRVTPEDERAWFSDAFRGPLATNLFANVGLSLTNQPAGTNRARRTRYNEAELVRERREGSAFDVELSARDNEPEKPLVRDPVLARALDLLKGLAVVRQSRS